MVLGLALVLLIVAAFVQPCKRSPDTRSPITLFHGDVHIPNGAFVGFFCFALIIVLKLILLQYLVQNATTRTG